MDVYASGPNAILGKIGHFMIILSFVAALVSTFAYGRIAVSGETAGRQRPWMSLGRMAYLLHGLAVFTVITLLLYMISHHMFEYSYVWRSSNRALPMRFLLSSFWEGQEGSTLLWMFWHVVIGLVLIFSARKWEAPVMMTVSLAQALLASMLMGIFIFGYKLGASPFILLKDTMDAPVFRMNPGFIPEDGSGLNPLLQNYWMTIHPPTMFLGYALTVVPFAYAVASLLRREYKDWVRPVFPWVLATVLILGTGLLMGGAWAYEALSFGGFWAWDPVENASLVPWLIMVAGLHTLLAYRYTGHSLPVTYILFTASFILVLYSSFLTKSGILGDSSVHSFTDMGMSGQLVFMILLFLLPALALLVVRNRELPVKKKEETLSSREFWLFIGSMVFVLSAMQITIWTSFPVFNKLFGLKLAPPADVEALYNNIQIWVAVMVGLLLAVTQFLSYRRTHTGSWTKQLLLPFVVAVVLSAALIIHYRFFHISELLLCFAAVFGVAANLQFLALRVRNKPRLYGSSLTHAGFALFLLGILISQGRQSVVSLNRFGLDYGAGFSEQENEQNILLYVNEASEMNNYKLTYLGDSVTDLSVHYKVLYEPLNDGGKPFVLRPYLQVDPNMGNVANPSTRRTINQDLYTHITAAPVTSDGRIPDSTRTEEFVVQVGDTIQLIRSVAILDGINPRADAGEAIMGPEDLAIGAQLRYITLDTTYNLEPVYLIQNRIARCFPEIVEATGVSFTFTGILPETAEIELTIEQPYPRYIIMKAIVFPWINLVWGGAIIVIIGLMISMGRRLGKLWD
jgi:cytochrome c-type biogenesis protein CcmF